MNGYFQQIGAWPEGGKRLARAYVLGFFGSLIFTLAAYFLVAAHALPRTETIGIVVALALAQVATQLICFLHLGSGASSRERLVIFLGAAGVVTILVAGSLWIMLTLNNRMMPSTQTMEQYMNDQDGF